MPESGAEAEWPADEGAAALVEAKEAVRRAGDANTRALAEHWGTAGFGCGTARAGEGSEPERTWGTEIRAVERAVDAQGGGKTPRTAREVEQAGGFAVLSHLLDAVEGLERADQDTAADASDFRGDVEHEVVAVAEIDVGMAAAKKHGAIARRRSAKVMGGGVALRIGFGFHDAPPEQKAGEFADDIFDNQ